MKKIIVILIFILTSFNLYAQAYSASKYLYSFSPLAEIIIRNLGMEDKNSNGIIDKGTNEGYEGFIEKYGNADIGFFINGITQGANNGILEENEIVNFYYTVIRFDNKYKKETENIEKEINEYIYANNVPLIWSDDNQGNVMKVVNHILGYNWQDKQVTLDEAEKMFIKVMDRINVQYYSGTPIASRNGYNNLIEFVARRKGYCFEVAQFGFWFFSQLKIKSINVVAALEPGLLHGIIKLPDNGKIIDYLKTSEVYKIPYNQWELLNPLQCISDYYLVQNRAGKTKNIIGYYNLSVIYNKYSITNVSLLMEKYANSRFPDYKEIIVLGEFIFNNIDIKSILSSNYVDKALVKNNLTLLLILLLESYSNTKNRNGFNNMVYVLNKFFSDDLWIKDYISKYQF